MEKPTQTLIHKLALGSAAVGLALFSAGCASKQETKIFDSRDTVPPPYHDPQSNATGRDWSRPGDSDVSQFRNAPQQGQPVFDPNGQGAWSDNSTPNNVASPPARLTDNAAPQQINSYDGFKPARPVQANQTVHVSHNATKPQAQPVQHFQIEAIEAEELEPLKPLPQRDETSNYVEDPAKNYRISSSKPPVGAAPVKVKMEATPLPDVTEELSVGLPPRTESNLTTYTVRKGDSLWKIARMYGVTSSELADANSMNKNDVLNVGKVLTIPAGGKLRTDIAPPPAAAVSPAPSATQTSRSSREPIPASGTYTVQKGDSLWKIGLRYNLRTTTIQGLNPHLSSTLQPGDTVYLTEAAAAKANVSSRSVPSPTPSRSTGAPTRDDWDTPSTQGNTGSSYSAPAPTASSSQGTDRVRLTAVTGGNRPAKHTVVSGDNLWDLSRKYGMSVSQIKRLNNLTSDNLHIGQTLVLSEDQRQVAYPQNETPTQVTVPTTRRTTPAQAPTTSVTAQDDAGTTVAADTSKQIKLPHFVEAGDTLDSIAEMYGSKKEWIIDANPELKNGTALQDLQHVEVPVQDMN